MTEVRLNADEACAPGLTPPAKEDRNYLLLVAGLLLALSTYVAMFRTVQAVWVAGTLDWDSGVARLLLLAAAYAAGVVLFGYECKREDWKAGCRFAAIWGGIALALALVYFVGLLKLLASTGFGFGGGDDSDSGDFDSEASDSASGDSSGGFTILQLSGPSADCPATCPICGLRIQEGTGGKCLRCEY